MRPLRLVKMKHFSSGQQFWLFLLALFILGLFYFRFYSHPAPSLPESDSEEIVIEVAGEVKNPGIHFFQKLPALTDAIEKAGGVNEGGHLDSNLLSETVQTGTLITLTKEFPETRSPHPSEGEGQSEGESLKKREINQGQIRIKLGRMEAHKLLVFSIPLDLNRVSAEDLCLIPGIGESLAQEVIAYRERRKGFRSIDELKNVKGIGEKKWMEFKTFLIVPR
jgi:competence protein ComEA